MSDTSGNVQTLVEQVAKVLVDAPDEVFVEPVVEAGTTVIELTVAEGDMGRIIGRQGRTARALRALVAAAGVRANKRYTLEILE
jgi:predicted RNA-binding protein YlqC (UPF0109 family)